MKARLIFPLGGTLSCTYKKTGWGEKVWAKGHWFEKKCLEAHCVSVSTGLYVSSVKTPASVSASTASGNLNVPSLTLVSLLPVAQSDISISAQQTQNRCRHPWWLEGGWGIVSKSNKLSCHIHSVQALRKIKWHFDLSKRQVSKQIVWWRQCISGSVLFPCHCSHLRFGWNHQDGLPNSFITDSIDPAFLQPLADTMMWKQRLSCLI